MNDYKLARGLGWASIGIGVTELAATRKLEEVMGIPNGQNSGTLRITGVREIMQGVDILTHADPTPGVWARVAGDGLDTALLLGALKKTHRRAGFWTIFALAAGLTALDVFCAARLSQKSKLRRKLNV